MQIDLIKVGQKAIRIFPYIVALVFACYLFQTCEDNKSLKTALSASQKEVTYFKNSLGRITTSKEVVVFQNKQQLKELIKKDKELAAMAKEFSRVKSTIKIKTVTKFDTIKQTFEIPVPCEFEREGEVSNEWYGLGYKVNEKGLIIEPFQTWSDINVVTGFKRKWFLGKQTYTTDVTATNPYIAIPEVDKKEVEVPKKWYDTTVFKVGIGIIGGMFLAK